jgi:hypothetical protein
MKRSRLILNGAAAVALTAAFAFKSHYNNSNLWTNGGGAQTTLGEAQRNSRLLPICYSW